MSHEATVVGVGLHEFGKFPDATAAGMSRVVAQRALEDAGLVWDQVDAVVVGSSRFSGGLARGLGATDVLDGLGRTSIPAFNVAAACATGGTVFGLAHLLVQSGRYETVLAVAGEKMPKGFIARSQGAPEDVSDVDYLRWACVSMPNPAYWAISCMRRMADLGTTDEDLARVSVKAHRLGAMNPYARYREEISLADVNDSPMVSSPLRLFELCAVSDGAAAAVLTTPDRAAHLDVESIHVAASEIATTEFGDPVLTMPEVSTRAVDGADPVSETTVAVRRALKKAEMEHSDIDLIELTDNSVWQELAFPEFWGFCEPGESDRMVRADETLPTGRLPINPSGGFLSFGEATVAMGLFQICELTWQLRGTAGDRQVPDAQTGLTQTLGLGGYGTAIILKR